MQIFRHLLRSEASPSIFPVLLHKRLNITHIFPYLTDPGQLANELAKQMISIKLIQEGALGDQILAHYAASARDFLFPTPQLSDTYPGVHREILMNRTQFYTGLLEPKLEFRYHPINPPNKRSKPSFQYKNNHQRSHGKAKIWRNCNYQPRPQSFPCSGTRSF